MLVATVPAFVSAEPLNVYLAAFDFEVYRPTLFRVQVIRVKLEPRGLNQGKTKVIRVGGFFELNEHKYANFYCICLRLTLSHLQTVRSVHIVQVLPPGGLPATEYHRFRTNLVSISVKRY